MTDNEDNSDRRGELERCSVKGKRNIFHYLSWSDLIFSCVFAGLAYMAFKCANRVDEWGWSHDFAYAFGWLCIISIFIACIYLILFQKHSFGASPEDKYDIVDDRDKDYEERQRKIREKYKH